MSNDSTPTIAFLGTGNMNGAILRGLVASGYDPASILATTASKASAEALSAETGVRALSAEEDAAANATAAAQADVVLLGVKPKGIVALATEIADSLRPEAVVVSVAAAIPSASIEAALPAGQRVVRSMPNTPLQLGVGAVGVSRGAAADDDAIAAATAVFAPSGVVVEVPEEQIDVVSAISGSGPAYAFYLAETMADGAVALGMEPELARRLAAATVHGAGVMLAQDGADAAALRKAVTSPNGTTERAIVTFDEEGVREAIAAGQAAALARAQELAAELG